MRLAEDQWTIDVGRYDSYDEALRIAEELSKFLRLPLEQDVIF